MLSSYQIIGHLAADPEMQVSDNDKTFTNFRVAVNTGYGDYQKTLWVPVVAFGKTAEYVNNYFTKGSRIAVVGELQDDSFENKDGVNIFRIKLVANQVKNLTPKSKDEDEDVKPAPRKAAPAKAPVRPAPKPAGKPSRKPAVVEDVELWDEDAE